MNNAVKVGVGHRDYGAFNNFDGLPVPGVRFVRQPYMPPRRLEKFVPPLGIIAAYAAYFLPVRRVDFYHTFNAVVLNRTPWVVTFESILPRVWEQPKTQRWLFTFLRRDECRRLLALSRNAAGHFRKQNQDETGLDEVCAKIEVIHPGIEDDPVSFAKHQALSEDRVPHLVFVGGQFFRKGGTAAVRAFQLLKEEMDVRMTVVSSLDTGNPILPVPPDAQARWREKLREAGVRHINSLPAAGVRSLFADADILLHPTLNDSFGYVVTEAMAVGVVPIVSRVDALPEVVSHRENGWLIDVPLAETGAIERTHVDLEDMARQLKEAVLWVLADRAGYRRLSEEARRTYVGKFSRDRLVRDLGRIYGTIRRN